jgi:hypothetical protein
MTQMGPTDLLIGHLLYKNYAFTDKGGGKGDTLARINRLL